jgi:hypothetical protein
MGRGKVFISYRRDDAAGMPVAIAQRLEEHLGPRSVFIDTSGIEPGADFVHRLESALDECEVCLLLIGKRWMGQPGGRSRLDDPRDWVRQEIATVLRRGIKVVPVLLDGAEFPAEGTLPQSLRPLARANAIDLRTSRLEADLRDLQATVMSSLGHRWPPDEPGGKIYATLSAGYALAVGAGLLLVAVVGALASTVETTGLLAMALFLLAAVVVLRLPLHHHLRTLTRYQALRAGALLHLIAFSVMTMGSGDVDGAVLVFFGAVPALVLFLASSAMQRRVRA